MVSLTKWDRNVKQKSRAMVRQKNTSILLFDGIEVLFEHLNNGVEACRILNPTRSCHSAFCTLSAMSKKAIVAKIVFTPRFGAVVQVRKNGRKFRCGALIDNAIDIGQRFGVICEQFGDLAFVLFAVLRGIKFQERLSRLVDADQQFLRLR